MGDTTRIGVLGLDAQADHEAAVGILAIEERPVVVEERAGAERGLKPAGGDESIVEKPILSS